MECMLIHPKKLKATVSEYELALAGLNYDKMEANDADTRRLMVSIIQSNKHIFKPSGKLFTEVYPADMGAVIYFTELNVSQYTEQPPEIEPEQEEFNEGLSFDSEIEVEDALDNLVDSLQGRHTRRITTYFQDVPASFVREYLEGKFCKFTVTARNSGCEVMIEPSYE